MQINNAKLFHALDVLLQCGVLSKLIDVGLVLVICDSVASMCEDNFKLFVVGLALNASFDHSRKFMWQHSGVAVCWC